MMEGIFGAGGGPLFSRLFSTTASLGADATFTRASAATVIDHEDVHHTAKSGEARFQFARRVENLLTDTEDFDAAAWYAAGSGSPTISSFGVDEGEAEWPTGGVGNVGQVNLGSFGDQQVVSAVDIKLVTGTPTSMQLYIQDSTGLPTVIPIHGIITSDYKRITVSHTAASAANDIDCFIRNNANTGSQIKVHIRYPQLQNKTGASDPTVPDDYVSVGVESAPYHGANVDGVKYFTTDNGNSVTSNVVTEATGATISPAPSLLMEPAATNYLLNSDVPATQTTESLGTGDYILWVDGTGSAAVTAGTATITGGGTASDGTPDLFTVTGAGTVTVTVTGSLDRFQLESGSVRTSYIPTTTVAVSRAADALSYSGIAADNETRAVENGTDVDVDDWDGVVDTTLDSDADGILELSSITVYTTGERPA